MSTLADDLAMLAELFASGDFSEVRARAPGLSVLLASESSTVAGVRPVSTAGMAIPSPAAPQPTSPVDSGATAQIIEANWLPVTAPNLGTFYRSPKPGAAPFVEVGSVVASEDEVCLLEVMKLFTSVKAGTAGIIRHVAASDAQLVEGGQILFHIEPRGS